ncbi:MAG: ABC transporter permease [Gammaproteobacteria bacterium]|nr:ABC transporter permease [Gammaproteobacteria bacterium]
MQIHLAMLVSDWLIYGLAFVAIIAIIMMARQPHLREPWHRVFTSRIGMLTLVVLLFYVLIGLLDSIHLQIDYKSPQPNQQASRIVSALDLIISPLGQQDEKTYSAPFASRLFSKATIHKNGKETRGYPKLKLAGPTGQRPKAVDIGLKILWGGLLGLASFLIIASLWVKLIAGKDRWWLSFKKIITGNTYIAWREAMIMFGIIWIVIFILGFLIKHYHILGTEKVGRDVFYEAIKSIRTGLLIGTLTSVFMLPFALLLGTMAGYFRGVIDDIIQYIYTTLSSIPGVLLISATILVMQVFIANHPALFPNLIQRADARLLALCFILGITSWASLCRLLRAETLKLREQEFVLAARALGVSRLKIIWRHIMPNVMHIVLITIVLDFSGLVLAEAVLSYVGVGVDPTTMSWGNMINSSRLEFAREPIVWWPLLAALIFMFILVLCANLFADSVRDAFDPRLKQGFQRNSN